MAAYLVFCYEYPPIGGGAGRALHQMARRWVRAGHRVDVVTSHFGDLPGREEVDGVRLIRLRCGRKRASQARVSEMVRYMVKSCLGARQWVRTIRPDLCIAFMTIPSGPAPYWIRFRFGIPYVTFLRGGDVPGFDPEKLKAYHRLTRGVILRIWKRSRAIIANSGGLAELARQSCPDFSFGIVPNGVDIGKNAQSDKVKSHRRLRLIFVGRLADSQKNASTLLRGLTAFRDAELEMIGDGPDRSYLE
ncbi:MAG: glycosyltransferase, partial [Candidatus Omnitrophica bacterium]|nr:glycosyltransferase [Candidatus Omnitrophota bacterium]